MRDANGLQAPIKWEPVDVTPILKDGKTAIPDDAIKSVQKNYVALKGPLAVCLNPVYSLPVVRDTKQSTTDPRR